MISTFACVFLYVSWAHVNRLLFSAHFFENNTCLFFPATAPLAKDATTSTGLMKRRRKKKKKKAGRPRSLTTLDTDTAAIWKTARTGLTRPRRSALSHLCDRLFRMQKGDPKRVQSNTKHPSSCRKTFRYCRVSWGRPSQVFLFGMHCTHLAVNHSTLLVAWKQQLLCLSSRPVKLSSSCNWAKELEVAMITDSLFVSSTLPLFFTYSMYFHCTMYCQKAFVQVCVCVCTVLWLPVDAESWEVSQPFFFFFFNPFRDRCHLV